MAAAPAVAAAVGVSRRGLAVFGPPAEDLVRAVVAAATGHAWRSLIDLKPKCVERRGLFTRDDVQAVINTNYFFCIHYPHFDNNPLITCNWLLPTLYSQTSCLKWKTKQFLRRYSHPCVFFFNNRNDESVDISWISLFSQIGSGAAEMKSLFLNF